MSLEDIYIGEWGERLVTKKETCSYIRDKYTADT